MVSGRRIAIIRHGERVDFLFSKEWIKTCFSDNNTYIKHDLNMPDEVPKRKDSPSSFLIDCPLTKIGVYQGVLTGEGLKKENVLRDGFEVFVSPALRCVQTATAISKGMNLNFKMKIEPCLFEWTGWFENSLPTWMTNEEYKDNGYNIDESYIPFMSRNMEPGESADTFYNRSFRFVKHLISSSDKDIMLVAHGASLDSISRLLCGGCARDSNSMVRLLHSIPYCAVGVVEEMESQRWSLISVPRITLRHGAVAGCDSYKILTQPY